MPPLHPDARAQLEPKPPARPAGDEQAVTNKAQDFVPQRSASGSRFHPDPLQRVEGVERATNQFVLSLGQPRDSLSRILNLVLPTRTLSRFSFPNRTHDRLRNAEAMDVSFDHLFLLLLGFGRAHRGQARPTPPLSHSAATASKPSLNSSKICSGSATPHDYGSRVTAGQATPLHSASRLLSNSLRGCAWPPRTRSLFRLRPRRRPL